MQEYVSEALVLDKDVNGDLDSRVALFTRRFGKFTAKVKSARKITSKLSGHLEPGNVVRVRLIEKNGLQAVDALKVSRIGAEPRDLYFLSKLLAESEPEPRLWQIISSGEFSPTRDRASNGICWQEILKILGWDPKEADCAICHRSQPEVFSVSDQEFFCKECASKLKDKEVILLDAIRKTRISSE